MLQTVLIHRKHVTSYTVKLARPLTVYQDAVATAGKPDANDSDETKTMCLFQRQKRENNVHGAPDKQSSAHRIGADSVNRLADKSKRSELSEPALTRENLFQRLCRTGVTPYVGELRGTSLRWRVVATLNYYYNGKDAAFFVGRIMYKSSLDSVCLLVYDVDTATGLCTPSKEYISAFTSSLFDVPYSREGKYFKLAETPDRVLSRAMPEGELMRMLADASLPTTRKKRGIAEIGRDESCVIDVDADDGIASKKQCRRNVQEHKRGHAFINGGDDEEDDDEEAATCNPKKLRLADPIVYKTADKFKCNLAFAAEATHGVDDVKNALAVVLDSDGTQTTSALVANGWSMRNIYIPNHSKEEVDKIRATKKCNVYLQSVNQFLSNTPFGRGRLQAVFLDYCSTFNEFVKDDVRLLFCSGLLARSGAFAITICTRACNGKKQEDLARRCIAEASMSAGFFVVPLQRIAYRSMLFMLFRFLKK